jgi:hypothetical protein
VSAAPLGRQAVDEVQLPLHFHTFPTTPPRTRQEAPQVRRAAMLTGVSAFQIELIHIIAGMMGAGVFERYPHLRVSRGESGAGWLAYALHRRDFEFEDRFRDLMKLKPSEYWPASARRHLGGVGMVQRSAPPARSLHPVARREDGRGPRRAAGERFPQVERAASSVLASRNSEITASSPPFLTVRTVNDSKTCVRLRANALRKFPSDSIAKKSNIRILFDDCGDFRVRRGYSIKSDGC